VAIAALGGAVASAGAALRLAVLWGRMSDRLEQLERDAEQLAERVTWLERRR
jgi:hypothetical protein